MRFPNRSHRTSRPPHPSLSPHWGERVAQGWRGTAEPYPELGEGGRPDARRSKSLLGLLRCRRGVTAIEFAMVIGAFAILIFGIIDVAMVLWTLGSLHYAAESAARCAAVNATTCGTATAVTTYAESQYWGQSLGTNPFAYSATGCGHTVTASYTYSMTIPMLGTYSIPLSATACFP